MTPAEDASAPHPVDGASTKGGNPAADLALVATEWFKATRRLARLTLEASPGRIERERAQMAYSQGLVEEALGRNAIRLVTHDGAAFSPLIPAEPVNPEDFDTEEGLVVSETIEPTMILEGRVIARGRVVLAKGK